MLNGVRLVVLSFVALSCLGADWFDKPTGLKFLPVGVPVDRDRIQFYGEDQFPRCYQHNGSVHSAWYNISAVQPQEKFGNANREFPWGLPAGTHDNDGSKSIKFVVLPEGKKIKWWSGHTGHIQSHGIGFAGEPVIRWQYPVGTVFGEILTLPRHGGDATFEVRTREKNKDEYGADSWKTSVYVPEGFDALVATNKRTVSLKNNHPTTVIDKTVEVGIAPRLSEKEVDALLAGKFVKSNKTFTSDESGIVPRRYSGAAARTSCTKCHEGTLKHAMEFQPNRDWYGTTRGSDGIFSLHIFDRSCISGNEFNQPVKLNRSLPLEQVNR
jgi:hypothetical protein